MASYGQEIPLQCSCCNKTFSGAVPAKQHFQSSAHKKKEQTARQSAAGVASYLMCDICNIRCDTTIILENHKASPRHLAMVEKTQHIYQSENQINQNYYGNGNAGSGHDLFGKGHLNEGTGRKEYDFDGNRGICYLCDIDLTSAQHATQHLNGSKHKKKQGLQSAMSMRQTAINPDNVQVLQRNAPFYHAQVNMNNIADETMFNQVTNFATEIEMPRQPQTGSLNDDKLYCETCGVRAEDHDSMIDHLKSSKHETNVLNKTIKLSRSSSIASGVDSNYTPDINPNDYVSYTEVNEQMSALGISDNQELKYNPDTQEILKKEPLYGDFEENPETESQFRKYFHMDSINLKPDSILSEESVIHNRSAEAQETDEIIAKPFPVDENHRFENAVSGLEDTRLGNRFSPTNAHVSVSHERNTVVTRSNSEQHPADLIRNNLQSPEEFSEHSSLPPLNNAGPLAGVGRGIFPLNNTQPNTHFMVKQNNLMKQNTEHQETDLHDLENTVPKQGFDDTKLINIRMQNLEFEDGIHAKPFTSDPKYLTPHGESIIAKPFVSESNSLPVNDQGHSIIAKPFSSIPSSLNQPADNINAKPFAPGPNSFGSGESRYTTEFKVKDQFDEKYNPKTVQDSETRNVNMNFLPDETKVNSAMGANNNMAARSSVLRTGPCRSLKPDYSFDTALQRGHCHICDVSLTSKQHMDQHLSGRKHKNAVELIGRGPSQRVVNKELFCDVCLVPFTGPEAQEMHLKSDKHKKKLEQRNGSNKPGVFFCDVCKVECSGEENYKLHLIGEKHKKKLEQKGDNITAGFYFCDACKIECSGEENYKQHLVGEKHRKKSAGFIPQQLSWQCDVCGCTVNSQEQLWVHQRSKHPEKYITGISQGGGVHINNSVVPNVMTGTKTLISNPLEEFLSLELFPTDQEFGSAENVANKSGEHQQTTSDKTVITPEITINQPVQMKPRYAAVPQVSPNANNLGDDHVESAGSGTKRSQGSDLAWAVRNKGQGNQSPSAAERPKPSPAGEGFVDRDQDNLGKTGNPSNYETTGAKPKGSPPHFLDKLEGENPFAGTHPYYCHTCRAPANTRESYESHLQGKRHLSKVGTEPAPVRSHCEARELGSQFKPHTQSTPRNYQWELYYNATRSDTVCFLPTGTGKTMVSVMLMSAMLEKFPTRPVLFVVDKVLLVLQQSKYITTELGEFEFTRYNLDSQRLVEIQRRKLKIATLCMDQQSTHGVPLWKHDIIVVTAAFCKNLLDGKIIRWEDFSLVVFDEAHHCDKKHPFNMLLYAYHLPLYDVKRPKIIGLTASPAGKDTVPATLTMLEKLVANMGGVLMNIVQKYTQTLAEFQSNAQIIIRPQPDQANEIVSMFIFELQVYLIYCFRRLVPISDMQFYVDWGKYVNQSSSDETIRQFAKSCIEENLEVIQIALINIQSRNVEDKYNVRKLAKHMESMCMALNSLMEGGIPCALEEINGLEKEEYNFEFAKNFHLPCQKVEAVYNHTRESVENPTDSNRIGVQQFGSHISRVVEELTNSLDIDWLQRQTVKPMALVLVKERATVHKITKTLQNNEVMQRMNLRVTSVVGHGKTGASDAAGMNVNQQKRVLEEIKQYKYQVIVATSVAEEGVDWPECELVISLYPPSTLTALVQMRGRARKKNSKFVVLCSSEEERQSIEDLKNRENNMMIASKMLYQKSLQS